MANGELWAATGSNHLSITDSSGTTHALSAGSTDIFATISIPNGGIAFHATTTRLYFRTDNGTLYYYAPATTGTSSDPDGSLFLHQTFSGWYIGIAYGGNAYLYH